MPGTHEEPIDGARGRVLALLERHGWNATSFQILERGFRYWFDGDDACVGYVDTGRAWVAAGPPVAPAERLAEISARFAEAAAAAGRRVCLFATEDRFRAAASWPALQIGEQPVWSPDDWEAALRGRRSLREQLRRARAKGVAVRALTPEEVAPGHATRVAIEALIARWLASRTLAPMGFLVQVEPFTFFERRRCFVAEAAGRIVGFLGIIPIYARGGWFFEDFLRDPAAPNGTIELLVDAGMRAAAAARISVVTLGLAPLTGDVRPWLRSARRLGRALYDFDGLRAFKAKLEPRSWSPIYLSYPPGRSPLLAVVDTLTAFARGGLVRFGLETLRRGPARLRRWLITSAMRRNALGLLVVLVVIAAGVVWYRLRDAGPTGEAPRAGDAAKAAGSAGPAASSVRTGAAEAPAAEAPAARGEARARRDALREQIARQLARRAAAEAGAGSAATPRPPADPRPPSNLRNHLDGRDALVARLNEDFMPLAGECIEQAVARSPPLSGMLAIGLETIADEQLGAVVDLADPAPTNSVVDPLLLECIRESAFSLSLPPPLTSGRERFELTLPVGPQPGAGAPR